MFKSKWLLALAACAMLAGCKSGGGAHRNAHASPSVEAGKPKPCLARLWRKGGPFSRTKSESVVTSESIDPDAPMVEFPGTPVEYSGAPSE